MNINYTKHAKNRCQQRAVPPVVVDWLLMFGAIEYDKHGAEIRFFNKRSRRCLAAEVGAQLVARMERLLNTYLVLNDEQIITVGYRLKHIKHP